MLWLAVGLGGALGSLARHGVNVAVGRVGQPVPYATAVSDIGVTDFTLTLTAVLAPLPDGAPIAVEWIAYV